MISIGFLVPASLAPLCRSFQGATSAVYRFQVGFGRKSDEANTGGRSAHMAILRKRKQQRTLHEEARLFHHSRLKKLGRYGSMGGFPIMRYPKGVELVRCTGETPSANHLTRFKACFFSQERGIHFSVMHHLSWYLMALLPTIPLPPHSRTPVPRVFMISTSCINTSVLWQLARHH